MMEWIISTIICNQFDKYVCPSRFNTDQAMRVTFHLHSDYDQEHGYRHLDILLYAPNNYVAVLVREDWNVAPVDDSRDVVGDYIEGDTGWKVAGYRDSCWRDAVQRVIFDNRERINSISHVFGGWYKWKKIPKELTGVLDSMLRDHQPLYVAGEGVFKFGDQ